MERIEIKKNILDLEHSENLAKGITEIGIASGSFISIMVSIYNKNLFVAIIVSLLFSLLFLVDGIKKLNYCKIIRNNMENLLKV